MKYTFPVINHIFDATPAIAGVDSLETIKSKVSVSLSSQTTVDNIRDLIGVTW